MLPKNPFLKKVKIFGVKNGDFMKMAIWG